MFDPSMMSAPLPPQPGMDPSMQDPAALAAMLGGGMPGMDPAMMGAPPMDPAMGGMPADPGMGMPMAGGNPYPTTDPNFMSEMLGQIIETQRMDQDKLQDDQQSALTENPLFEALMSGAPMGPGAGQDGAAIGMGGELPMPTGMG